MVTIMPASSGDAYYNENDPFAAAWLRNLIKAGLIAKGEVDERSIVDVTAGDLAGYTQCHFFAGIGGWSYALRLAGWPDSRPCWTGSCPCQPFSAIGYRKGVEDARHLWPAFFANIAKLRPPVVFGEQVAGKDGREWFARVRIDLESVGYACAGADLCAAGVSAPHIRQRIYWVGDADKSYENERTSGGQQPIHDGYHGDSPKGMGKPTGESMGECRQPWEHSETIECEDGWRRIESGAQPLVERLPYRLDKLRAYGNAIVPQVAAEFIVAFMECRPE